MVMFDHNTAVPQRQQTNASFLLTLMTDVGARRSASLFRFLYDEDNVLEISDDDHDDGKNNSDVLCDYLWEMEVVATPHVLADLPITFHSPYKTREEEYKVSSNESTGELMVDYVIVPAQRAELLLNPMEGLQNSFGSCFTLLMMSSWTCSTLQQGDGGRSGMKTTDVVLGNLCLASTSRS
jgi:hypothetical protein